MTHINSFDGTGTWTTMPLDTQIPYLALSVRVAQKSLSRLCPSAQELWLLIYGT